MKSLLGGKGANLAEMAKLGLPVPPGFTISTDVCTYFYANQRQYPASLKSEVEQNVKTVESLLGRKFGATTKPLLLSIRSGARASMPGMMDTILNLGLNDQTVEALASESNNPRFAFDCYRRFIQMYADVVMDVHSSQFETLIEELKHQKKLKSDQDLSADDWKLLCQAFKQCVFELSGKHFPQNPIDQLWGAIGAVFGSWMNPRAIHYRKMESIPQEWGTAVNIQSMVFGNMGETSATGVAFTRDPGNGEKRFFGEYLINAQGEDVVAGIRNPQPLQKTPSQAGQSLEEVMPEIYRELVKYQAQLETHYRDMQDLEFTIQQGKLFMLQTRNGKRTAQAAVKIAVDMAREKLISEEDAVMRINPYSLDQLLHPRLDDTKAGKALAKGLPASPGAVVGEVIFNSDEAQKARSQGIDVVLVRHETSPEDVHGMDAAVGILTALGGMTSHAAVVARGMGKPCIAGCSALHIDYKNKRMTVETQGKTIEVKEGDLITLDGNSGSVYLGQIPTIHGALSEDFNTLMSWADRHRSLEVRANADTPHDARTARQFGAKGIGLCRTEHMFFEPDRIEAVREMILAESQEGRVRALEKIFPMQKNDFVGLFREMKGLPVTIRLLDPPLHEFLPHEESTIRALAVTMGTTSEKIQSKVTSLREANPMLGHRGCRLAITYPEIYEMQARAIAEAIVEAFRLTQEPVHAEIMIPLVMLDGELTTIRQRIEYLVHSILKDAKLDKKIDIGTMIELPRACLIADQLAEHADFFSFGTNDLTQTCLGLSRDDSGRFIPEYLESKILTQDPFASIDQVGVGALVRLAVEKAKSKKPHMKLGVCGEHGGDAKSIAFFHDVGLQYVSCSPFRIPAARLAAAQAKIQSQKIASPKTPTSMALKSQRPEA